MGRLEKALKARFPGENSSSLAEILLEASLKGVVSYEDLEGLEDLEDLMLLAHRQRLLIPLRISAVLRSLSWDSRILLLKPGETYEMPPVVRFLVREAEKTGKWLPLKALLQCLLELGEEKPLTIVKATRMIMMRAARRNLKIRAEEVERIASKLGLNAGSLIAKLKGAGVLSPCSRGFLSRGILYEVNPSLYRKPRL